MPSKYYALLDILNIKKNLIWNKTLLFLYIEKIKLLDMDILEKETAYYTDKDSHRFFQGQGFYQNMLEGELLAQSAIQFLQVLEKCYVY